MGTKGWYAVNTKTGRNVSKMLTYVEAQKLVTNLNDLRKFNNEDPIYKVMSIMDYESWTRERNKPPGNEINL